mgnify:CR=1 FL=1
MMDVYSFDKTEEDMKKTYNLMHQVYLNIFKRLEIKIIPTIYGRTHIRRISSNNTVGRR